MIAIMVIFKWVTRYARRYGYYTEQRIFRINPEIRSHYRLQIIGYYTKLPE